MHFFQKLFCRDYILPVYLFICIFSYKAFAFFLFFLFLLCILSKNNYWIFSSETCTSHYMEISAILKYTYALPSLICNYLFYVFVTRYLVCFYLFLFFIFFSTWISLQNKSSYRMNTRSSVTDTKNVIKNSHRRNK